MGPRRWSPARRSVAAIFLASFLLANGVAAQTLPIVDLHFHPEEGWSFEALPKAFDQAGVTRACNGPKGPDSLAIYFAESLPGRYLAYAGQGVIRDFILSYGERAWNLEEPEVLAYLDGLEGSLQIGLFTGIGELFVNNENSQPPGVTPTRFLPTYRAFRYWDAQGDLQRLIQEHEQTFDPKRRRELAAQIQRGLREKVGWLFLWQLDEIFGVSKKVKGFLMRADHIIWAREAYVEA